MLKKQGKYEQALEMYNQSLATKFKMLGRDHPVVADTLYNIALVHQTQGQHDLEAEFSKNVRSFMHHAFSPPTPPTLDSLFLI